jgi:hypothetical protein
MPLTVQIGSEQVRICNAAAGAKASTLKVCQGGRGWAKTRPVNHSAGEPVARILDAFSAAVSDPDQGYAYFAYAASVYLASLTVNDSITGAPITGDSAIEWMWAHLPGREKLADDPKWAYQPRMQIASVAVAASATDAHLSYTSPVGGACRIGLGDGSLRSSDDAGDEAASGDTSKREHTFSGLKPGSTYQYRITCGTKKQPVRALGFFQTK